MLEDGAGRPTSSVFVEGCLKAGVVTDDDGCSTVSPYEEYRHVRLVAAVAEDDDGRLVAVTADEEEESLIVETDDGSGGLVDSE